MLYFYYTGFDGYKYHGCIEDRIIMESTPEEVWEEVVEYVKEKHDGKAQVKILGAGEVYTIDT
jgi:hypothetical protein